MERLCTIDTAIVQGKKCWKGITAFYQDHCEFFSTGSEKEFIWRDIRLLRYEIKEIKVPGFLFSRKRRALCLYTQNDSLALVMSEESIQKVMVVLEREKEQAASLHTAAEAKETDSRAEHHIQKKSGQDVTAVLLNEEAVGIENRLNKPLQSKKVAPHIVDELAAAAMSNPNSDAPVQHTGMFTHDGIELSEEQAHAYRLAEGTNLNLYITGKAGTGKSVVLRYFRRHTRKRVAVLAPTGVAAINVGGQTIHSFFHLQPGILVDFDVSQIRGFDKLADKVGYFDTIVIDEISMVRADVLDAMDAILRKARRRETEPFGGCQMIFVGDLYQLPPVVTNEDKEAFGKKYETPFFFGAASVSYNNFNLVELTHVYRQSDSAFIDTLNQIREGNAPERSLVLLNKRADVESPKDHCIILTLHRATARRINMENLHKLEGPSFTYDAEIRGDFLGRDDQEHEPDPPVEKALELRVGAKVIMMVNDKGKRWVNGTMGVVEDLHTDEIKIRINENVYSVNKYTWSKYRYEYNRTTKRLIQYEVGSYTQYPIALAYAITIHKSQGQTYDRVKIDFADRNAFAEGQTYVALSRCRSLEGLYLGKAIERKDIIVSQEVKHWMGEFAKIMKTRVIPTMTTALPAEYGEQAGITVENIPEHPFEWTDDGRIKANIPISPKKMTGTRFAQIMVPGKFNSPFEAWCEIMRVYEKPYEDNMYTRAGEAIQPIQTKYVQQDERFLDVADPQAVYGENPEEQTCYDFFPKDDLFGGMWDAVGRTESGEIAKVYEMKTTGIKNARFWQGERFGIPLDKLLQGALYAYMLGLNAVTMVSSYLKPEDYDNPERYECSHSNTQVQEISLSEISQNFERDYICKAREWWENHVVTGLSPRFDPVKDREIIAALERMVPRVRHATHVPERTRLYRSPVGMNGVIDDYLANSSSDEFYGNIQGSHLYD